MNNSNLVYDKPYHYIDSISVFLDMDTPIYTFVLALIIWGIIRLVCKLKGKRGMSFLEFLARYLYTAYVPVFLFYLVSLIISQKFITTNIIITFLPLVYGVILQAIFIWIKRIRDKKKGV